MSECIICGNAANLFHRKKTFDGFLCSTCMSHIPQVLKPSIRKYSLEQIREIIAWIDKYHSYYIKTFDETASYGDLHIDEYHGLFAICSKKQIIDGKLPDTCYDIFSCLDLTDVGLATKNAAANDNSVNVDIELMCEIDHPAISFKKIIKSNAKCIMKRLDSETVQYSEPESLSVFRNIFNQMLKSALEKYNYNVQNDFLTKQDVEIFAAKSLFMLDEVFSKEELKQQRNRMLKVFHPDEANGESSEMATYTKRINDAYKLLLPKAM